MNKEILGKTKSLCEHCLKLIDTEILKEEDKIYYNKFCKTHGNSKVLISDDADYYIKAKKISKEIQHINNVNNIKCPFECIDCSIHEQKAAMAIVEILDECNLSCPTCIAASHLGAGKIKSISLVEDMIDSLIIKEPNLDLLMISGGEPTIHPYLFEILDIAKKKNIKHLMLISNGVRIANDLDFVNKLKKYKENFEIYLQFDSINNDVLLNIRGENLKKIRLNSLKNLENAGIHSTLISVVKKGVNDKEVSDVINFALNYKYVRGVTFQPVKETGRSDTYNKELNYITLTEIRNRIINENEHFSDLIPHPLNPENMCIGYLNKDIRNKEITKELIENSVDLDKMMYFLPTSNNEKFKYENLFRVTIVSFLDKYNFCEEAIKKSCIKFITKEKNIIPLDTYYLFYSEQNKAANKM